MKHENLNSLLEMPAPASDMERSSADGPTDPAGTQTAHHSVIIWDCLEVMRTLPDRCINVVVTLTPPPYNIGISYRSYDDRRPREEYLTWMGNIAAEVARLLTDDGALFLNLRATGPDPWIAQDVAAQFRAHLVLQNRITWVKSIAVDGVTRRHQRPIKSNRLITRTNEEVYHFTR